ncbi:hypothetical protein OHA02_14745 [Streptomyces phaeochromogenes]|nr:hypothetical protein [Streptomyces phaeochromogenes]
MAADWVARGIALGAGIATALNMVISFATYRRGRPRVGVEITGVDAVRARDGISRVSVMCSVRLVNRGNTSVDLEDLRFIVKFRGRRVQYATEKTGFSRRTLEPFAGKVVTRSLQLAELRVNGATVAYVRLVARLSNGKHAWSKKIRPKNIPGLPQFKRVVS